LIVIASEAKQSRGHKEELDCFVAALLAMTASAVDTFLHYEGQGLWVPAFEPVNLSKGGGCGGG
jgi:hypothetical protein